MVKNKTIRCLAILHEIEKYLTGAEYNKAAIYSHLAGMVRRQRSRQNFAPYMEQSTPCAYLQPLMG